MEEMKAAPKVDNKTEAAVLDVQPEKKDVQAKTEVEGESITEVTTPDLAEKTPADEKAEAKKEA